LRNPVCNAVHLLLLMQYNVYDLAVHRFCRRRYCSARYIYARRPFVLPRSLSRLCYVRGNVRMHAWPFTWVDRDALLGAANHLLPALISSANQLETPIRSLCRFLACSDRSCCSADGRRPPAAADRARIRPRAARKSRACGSGVSRPACLMVSPMRPLRSGVPPPGPRRSRAALFTDRRSLAL
jgi:hypothetical protein